MAFKQMTKEQEAFQQNVQQLRDVEQRAAAWMEQRPLTEQQQAALDTYQQYRPAIQQLLKIAEHASSSGDALQQMQAELAANKPSRAKEVAAGLGSGAAGALSAVGHPFVQLYEWTSGKEIVTLKDTKEVLGEAGKYLSGKQTRVWAQAAQEARRFDMKLESFYESYNQMTRALFSGDRQQLQTAQDRLAYAMEGLGDAHGNLSSLLRQNHAELEQLSGFLSVSGEFVKNAAIEVAITITAAKALQLAAKGAVKALPKIAEMLTKETAEGAVAITRAEVIVARGVTAVEMGERTLHTAKSGYKIYYAGETIHHTAEQESQLEINPVAGR
ncbi:MAG TPA: hypothetical protein VJH24_00750 [Candidatus Bilamarchaeaceae archaeon]|nr:hypothetical protein [Candidatus Bilamarchaeaceae archaeon]